MNRKKAKTDQKTRNATTDKILYETGSNIGQKCLRGKTMRMATGFSTLFIRKRLKNVNDVKATDWPALCIFNTN